MSVELTLCERANAALLAAGYAGLNSEERSVLLNGDKEELDGMLALWAERLGVVL